MGLPVAVISALPPLALNVVMTRLASKSSTLIPKVLMLGLSPAAACFSARNCGPFPTRSNTDEPCLA